MSAPEPKDPNPGRRVRYGRASGRGFTLVETMLVMCLLGLILALLSSITVDTSRLGTMATTSATLLSQTRLQLDTLTQDLRSSDAVLASYTPSGGPTYASDAGTTLVLELPALTADGSSAPETFDATTQTWTPTAYDHIIYQLVGNSAPYTLNRRVIPSAGSGRAALADTAVVSNVQSAAFGYQVTRTLIGTGQQTVFPIDTFSGPVQTVTVNGAALPLASASGTVPSGSARFTAPSTLTFGTAPQTSDVVDAAYSVSPASAAAVNSVSLDLTVSATNGALGASATQTVELTSTANLSGH